ncbi:reverse gyrase [Archaeoglobus veneficus]|uniref:Reverse gyrase n=1 Tax=Archaeoglobus veneficus (strain DSM 11195 / SNP6) TaxID=693661 RepID=F2KSF0_ARCVS|nr:reverse gyrase [Archaeoglobus veneficus]AEA46919.1 reverse gyrase [Archaeoglobus veneficus SNP6]
MVEAIYAGLCPACGGDLKTSEAKTGKCSRNIPLCRFAGDEVVEEFIEFFRNAIGEPRAVQKFWARRILRGESFAAVAPTGIGKTSFGAAMALFLATKGKKSYIILPTTLLVEQVAESLAKYGEKAGVKVSLNNSDGITVLYYHGRMGKAEKEKFFELIQNADILVTTTQFLSRHFESIKRTFDFVFVDDVDAILKASRNVDRVLMLLGFRKTKKGWEGEARGVLMVSTATAKKGQKIKLFRQLLNFDVGSSTHAVRNIEDIAVEKDDVETIASILEMMGTGGIIYARNTQDAEMLYEALKEKFKIGIVTSGRKKDYELFESGEIDYLIGTAYYYGTLVRGLDLPERIRFAVFVGAPTFTVKLEDVESASPGIIRILALIFRDSEEVKEYLSILPVIDKPEHEKELAELRKILKKLVEEGKAKEKDVVVRKGEVIFPDLRTYIQGSGRTSRLFAGGITKGASFLLESDEEVRNAFVERAKHYDIEFKRMEEVNFEELIKEINESRVAFRRRKEAGDVVKPTLFIVESPTKAKQISRFFGQPSVKAFDGIIAYEVPTAKRVLLVSASLGHVTDLITNRGFHGVEVNGHFVPVYASIKRCRQCGYQFTEERQNCPKCGSEDIDDSKRRIEALRKLAHDAGEVIIGTDPDAEGEKIAWDIQNLLAGCGEIRRAEFHEVTRRAVSEALENLRSVDENLVKAQIVRRIEDRWIGFVLSQKLWKAFGSTNLSAGRAQTPVLGWVIERAEQHREKKVIGFIRDLELSIEGLKAKKARLRIRLIEEKEEEKTPLPPYTTDAMLRDANAILKIPAKEAMAIAQTLFESGLITYHRTDSTRVSEAGMRVAREYLGEDFVAREWFAEGAHECIRPTRAVDKNTLQRLIQENVIAVEDITWRHLALYDLIFRRFMASQCKPYTVRVCRYLVEANGISVEEERVIDARGKAYELYKAVWVRKPLPEGEVEVDVEVRRVPKVPLYTQSDLIQLMREKGIGRPSTYATIIDKLFQRNYVVERNGRVMPTKRGMDVFGYLVRRYAKFVSEERTRILEEKMDAVERGELDYLKALEELYAEIKEITA